MANAEHTQSPWEVRSGGSDFVVSTTDGRFLFKAFTVNGNTIDETEANAHLAAAAPELLEALEGLLTAYARLAAIGEETARVLNAAEGKARKAIAKARGQQ